jgi:hypothetical protein
MSADTRSAPPAGAVVPTADVAVVTDLAGAALEADATEVVAPVAVRVTVAAAGWLAVDVHPLSSAPNATAPATKAIRPSLPNSVVSTNGSVL